MEELRRDSRIVGDGEREERHASPTCWNSIYILLMGGIDRRAGHMTPV